MELLVFKLFGFNIQRRLVKDPGILKNIDFKYNGEKSGERGNSGENFENSNLNLGSDLLNEKK